MDANSQQTEAVPPFAPPAGYATNAENELNEWLADARQWERRFDVLRSLSRGIGVEVDEVEEVVIKDGKERRVIWSGVEIRRYDYNGRLLSVTREGKASHNEVAERTAGGAK